MLLFEKASRKKYRFVTDLGSLNVEDMWELPLLDADVCLDGIAKDLNKQIKVNSEESFVVQSVSSPVNEAAEDMFEIVKHIIKVRLEEALVRDKAIEIKAKKQRLLEILASKEDDDLKGKSVEEIKELLAEL